MADKDKSEWQGDYEIVRLEDGNKKSKRRRYVTKLSETDFVEIERKRLEKQHRHQSDVEFGYEDIDLMDDTEPVPVAVRRAVPLYESQADKSKDKGWKLQRILELSSRLDSAEKEIVKIKEEMSKLTEHVFES